MEEGRVTRPDAGTPQGGVISPLLANVYLDVVLDAWFEREVKPKLRGPAFLVRYADDFVILFANEADALAVYGGLPARFGQYGLTLHPEKTKLVAFRPPIGDRPTESFDLLGFTHLWSRSLQGNWIVKRLTAKKRLSRALVRVGEWCQANRHRPVREQHAYLSQVVRGHCGYFGITGNSAALQRFREGVKVLWEKWLRRRSNAAARKGREWWDALCRRYPIPVARVAHSVLRHT